MHTRALRAVSGATGCLMAKAAILGLSAPLLAQDFGADFGTGSSDDTTADTYMETVSLRYEDCLTLAERDPSKAINTAFAWDAETPSALARHCLAIGIFTLGQHAVAADRLEVLAEDMRAGKGMPVIQGRRLAADPVLLGTVLNQAANAWLLAGEIDKALAAIDQAIVTVPDRTPEHISFLVDRARIAAADQDWGLAYDDLLHVRDLDPRRRDVLLLIASAARHMGYGREAEIALNNYFVSYPDDPAAYLELGNLYDLQGRVGDARTAYRRVLALEEDGPNAEAARDNLARLDIRPDK